MMSFKIPCGGFKLDEKSFSLDVNGVLSVSGGGSGGATTLHINVTAVNRETMEATFTADKTPAEIQQAALDGPVWCVVSFPAGILGEKAFSFSVPPAWSGFNIAFGCVQALDHDSDGSNIIVYAVSPADTDTWVLDLNAFSS